VCKCLEPVKPENTSSVTEQQQCRDANTGVYTIHTFTCCPCAKPDELCHLINHFGHVANTGHRYSIYYYYFLMIRNKSKCRTGDLLASCLCIMAFHERANHLLISSWQLTLFSSTSTLAFINEFTSKWSSNTTTMINILKSPTTLHLFLILWARIFQS
jgi:hypothetical protein